jgi:solute carrier family 25 folate transporter 32
MHPSVVHCGSAVATGAIADLICNPLFVVRTRLQTQALHQKTQFGMIQMAADLYASGGARIFWRGMTANLIGLSHVAVQFPTYERLKKMARERRNGQELNALDLLLASFMAKVAASLLTYPHEVIRSRMMDSRAIATPTLVGTAKSIFQKEGMGGFYIGLPVTLLRVIPNCCITFISYELLLRWSKEQIHASRQQQGQPPQPQQLTKPFSVKRQQTRLLVTDIAHDDDE